MSFLCTVLWVVLCYEIIDSRAYEYNYFNRSSGISRYKSAHPVGRSYMNTAGNSGQAKCQILGNCSPITPNIRSKPPSKLKTIFEWKQMDFDYENIADRLNDIKDHTFIPGKSTPLDVDVYYGRLAKSVFVTVPRFAPGIPATLGTVTVSKLTGQPAIKPYPSWKWHRYPEKCMEDRLVSTYRIKIDSCGKLWALDTGRLQSGQVCPMQIIAFDLETNQLLHRKVIPESLLDKKSILVTPIVELLNNNCWDTFIYIADTVGFSIIVYDVKKGTFWKASDRTMYPYPNQSSFNIFGDKFVLVDGILGMDLGPKTQGEDRKLYYHSLSSVTENWVYTKHLRNASLFGEYPWVHPEVFNEYEGTRKSQSAAQAITQNGVSFFGELSKLSINCWNTATEFGSKNIDVIEYNLETLQFPSGMKVVDYPSGYQELWILTSSLQKVIAGSLQEDVINFRVLAAKVNDILVGTKCGVNGYRSGKRFNSR